MKKILTYSAALALILAVASPALAQAPGAPPTGGAPGMMQGKHKEHHPEIHKAMHALEHAKDVLQHADRDFDGHRTKAVEHIDAAMGELREALASDKH